MKKLYINLIVILFLLISIISVESWSSLHLSTSLTFSLIRTVVLIIPLIWAYKVFQNPFNKPKIGVVSFFLVWIILTGLKSLIIAKGKEQWEFLLMYLPAMLSFITVYYLDNPTIFRKINYYWFRFAPILCLSWYPFMTSKGEAIGFFLPLLLLHLLFITVIPNKSKFILLILTFLIIIICYKEGARSHVLKFGIALILGISLYLKSAWYYLKAIKILRYFMLYIPIILFVLGITNIFNVFKMDEYIEGDYTYYDIDSDGESQEASLVADTRTFLYEEAILSAVKNRYVIFGRSFARGYDSYFQVKRAEIAGKTTSSKTAERISEVAIINIFTWMGLIGLILYFAIFVKATAMAVYYSNNYYIKIVGLFLSFRWMYGWVEDFQRLDISTLTMWMLFAICLSKSLRSLTDYQISKFIKSIFIK